MITLQVSKEGRTSRRLGHLRVTSSSSRGLSLRFTASGRCSLGLCGPWGTRGIGKLLAKLCPANCIIVIEAEFLQDIDGSLRNEQNYILATDICPLHSHITFLVVARSVVEETSKRSSTRVTFARFGSSIEHKITTVKNILRVWTFS